MINPIDKLKITASKFRAFTYLLPAKIVSIYATGKMSKYDFKGFPIRRAPKPPIKNTSKNCKAIMPRLLALKTLVIKSERLLQPNTGTGNEKPTIASKIINPP